MPSRPIMIAVGGDSGSGKTTLCRGIYDIFGAGRLETRYIAPQARYADLVLTFFRSPGWSATSDPAKLSARIRKCGRFRALEHSEFTSGNTHFRQLKQTAGNGHPETIVELDGDIEPAAAEAVERKIGLSSARTPNSAPSAWGFSKTPAARRRSRTHQHWHSSRSHGASC